MLLQASARTHATLILMLSALRAWFAVPLLLSLAANTVGSVWAICTVPALARLAISAAKAKLALGTLATCGTRAWLIATAALPDGARRAFAANPAFPFRTETAVGTILTNLTRRKLGTLAAFPVLPITARHCLVLVVRAHITWRAGTSGHACTTNEIMPTRTLWAGFAVPGINPGSTIEAIFTG